MSASDADVDATEKRLATGQVRRLQERISTLEARLARVLLTVHEGRAWRHPWPGIWSRHWLGAGRRNG